MPSPVRWGYNQQTKRWSGDDGEWVLYQVEEGEHAGEHALEDGRGNVSYHASHQEAREEADRIKKVSGLR